MQGSYFNRQTITQLNATKAQQGGEQEEKVDCASEEAGADDAVPSVVECVYHLFLSGNTFTEMQV